MATLAAATIAAIAPPPAGVTAASAASLEAVNPARLLDTRPGGSTADSGHSGTGRVDAGTSYVLPVLGRGGVPGSADAVMLNVTAVNPDAPGYLTVHPCGTQRPTASNVNYVAGATAPNAVLAKIGDGGAVCIFSLATTDLVVDVNGFVPVGGAPIGVDPARLADTRPGEPTTDGAFAGDGAVAEGDTYEVQVAGRGHVPSGTTAVLLNVTAAGAGEPGYLTVFPCDRDRPHASNVNYGPAEAVPNAVLAKLSSDGRVCVFARSTVHVIIDVNGHVPLGGAPVGLTPARLVDTRPDGPTDDGTHSGSGMLPAGQTYVLPVAGRGGVPTDAVAAMLNVTAITPNAAGYLTVFPCGAARPTASNVNYGPGDVAPNAVLARLGSDGSVCIFTLADVHLAIDVNGYVLGPPPELPADANYSAVSAGDDHTCAVVAQFVQCWGDNVFGQLGIGHYGVDAANLSSATPLLVPRLDGAVTVASGQWFSCATRVDGTVWCWGVNTESQLGGESSYADEPSPIQVPDIDDASAVVAGEQHACVLRTGGTVACWGANYAGQVGDGTDTMADRPTAVLGLAAVDVLTAGADHTCAVTGAAVYCWGANGSGQSGGGEDSDQLTPTLIDVGGPAAAVAAGEYHTCALRTDASVWCWGDNSYGQLGRPGASSETPVQVDGVDGAIALDGGRLHTCAVVAGGAVRCWGSNWNGELGVAEPAAKSPSAVGVPGTSDVVAVTAGTAHTCALGTNGTLQCWGSNVYSQLGSGSHAWRHTPAPVTGLTDVVEIEADGDMLCARGGDGSVSCWGAFTDGNPDPTHWWTPHPIGNLTDATALGGRCAVRSTGTVACWGFNVPSASDIDDVDGAVGVHGTFSAGCAVLDSGGVRCWDDPGLFAPYTVADVAGISDALAVAGIYDDFCAVRASGTVACWDLSDMGSLAAQNVSGVSAATAVAPHVYDWAADDTSFCAIDAAQLECWVSGSFDAMPVPEIGSVTALDGTPFQWSGHICVVTEGGAVECWGEANHGRLGRAPYVDANDTDPSVGPADRGRPLGAGATAVATATGASCALLNDGTVSCWGDRTDGKLGDGSGAWVPQPTDVAGP